MLSEIMDRRCLCIWSRQGKQYIEDAFIVRRKVDQMQTIITIRFGNKDAKFEGVYNMAAILKAVIFNRWCWFPSAFRT